MAFYAFQSASLGKLPDAVVAARLFAVVVGNHQLVLVYPLTFQILVVEPVVRVYYRLLAVILLHEVEKTDETLAHQFGRLMVERLHVDNRDKVLL